MDHEQRAFVAQQQDGELAARVVRSIAQIEQDAHYAWTALSERLMRDIGGEAQKAAPEPWIVEGTEGDLIIISPEWKANRGVNQKDAWFELADLIEDDADHSWVSVLVNAGRTKLGLELKFRPGLVPIVQVMKDKDAAIAGLLKAGFQREATGRLFLPIVIDSEALAKGLEFNDLANALAPIRDVVATAVSLKAPIYELIEHVRAEAKKK